MAQWKYTVNIADIWNNDELPFEERRDEIVKRIRASDWYKVRNATDLSELFSLTEDLEVSDTPDEFDEYWNLLYDEADADRCWIATF